MKTIFPQYKILIWISSPIQLTNADNHDDWQFTKIPYWQGCIFLNLHFYYNAVFHYFNLIKLVLSNNHAFSKS